MRNFKTIQQSISDDLRKKIIQGRIKVGERIRIDQVSNQYGVSTMPAREAVLRLESEGFLTFYPYRGAVVKELSIQEVEEIFKIRQIMESAAAQLAIQNLGSDELNKLEELLMKMEKIKDIPRWLELNWQFHETIYEPCRLPRFCKMIRNLRNDINRYLVTSLLDPDLREIAERKHRKIFEACQRKEIGELDLHVREHLQETSDALIRILREEESG